MRSLLLIAVGFAAATATAQSPVFRQRIRIIEVHGLIQRADDNSINSQFTCLAVNGDLVDGGAWPLLNSTAGPVDGGNPNAVINTCATLLQTRNLMDGGLL